MNVPIARCAVRPGRHVSTSTTTGRSMDQIERESQCDTSHRVSNRRHCEHREGHRGACYQLEALQQIANQDRPWQDDPIRIAGFQS